MAVGGRSVDDCVLLACRLSDSLLPPLLAVMLFGLALSWWPRDTPRRGGWPMALGLGAAALTATASLPVLRMTSDYQKNSVGLVFLVGLIWALHLALAHGGRRRWLLASTALVLIALTHVAVFGAAVLLTGATLVSHARLTRRPERRHWAAGVVVLAVALGGLAVASPGRGLALLAAPVELIWHRRGSPPPDPLGFLVALAVYGVLVWGVLATRAARATQSPARLATVAGAGLCAALLACPMLNEEFFRRLVLIAPAPASVVLAHLLLRRAEAGRSAWPALAVAALSLGSVVAGLAGGDLARGILPTVVTPSDVAELRAMRPLALGAGRTVVLAHKGLVWWVAFEMNVAVREDKVAEAALAGYQRVLLIEEKAPRLGPEPEPPGDRPPPPPAGPGDEPARPYLEQTATRARLDRAPVLYDGTQYRLPQLRP
ncbi:MAG: hypothetical protein HZB16_03890 [Armatimonadetes bacterium]|nr:hypothetical protein [Armatimonadota bacterium]